MDHEDAAQHRAADRESAAPDQATLTGRLDGRVLSAAGRPLPERITVWFAYRTTGGEAATVETETDRHERFNFELPTAALLSAKVGAVLEGVRPVDLEPAGMALTSGSVVLIVDDLVPEYLRFGCVL